MNDELANQLESEEISESLIDWAISTGPRILLILILFYITTRLIKFAVNRFQSHSLKAYEKRGNSEGKKRIITLSELLRTVLNVVVYVAFIMVLLSQLGVDIAPLLASVGIFGLAVSIGAQELVRDVIAGFFMLLENQLRVGDVAKINGTSGIVERIEIRTIVLRDFAGEVHVFQNGKINSLTNKTKDWSAAVFDIGIAYHEDPAKVIEVIKQVGSELQKDPILGPGILEPIEVLGLDNFGESEMVIKSRIKTKPGLHGATGREFRKLLKQAFDQNDIEIPFPQRTIHWKEYNASQVPTE